MLTAITTRASSLANRVEETPVIGKVFGFLRSIWGKGLDIIRRLVAKLKGLFVR
jgi:hypothetical protein